MAADGQPQAQQPSSWPEGLTRVPYWVFQRDDVYAQEQKKIFQGDCWSFLCLESDVAKSGDWRTTFVGDAPVVVTRNAKGEIHAFENRCVHRGALICLDEKGKSAKDFACFVAVAFGTLLGSAATTAFADPVLGDAAFAAPAGALAPGSSFATGEAAFATASGFTASGFTTSATAAVTTGGAA